MGDYAQLTLMVSAMWLSVAILAAGYARTRNRSAWGWFLLTMIFGPIAVLLLVVWPPVEKPTSSTSQQESARHE